jgi:tetratricopeptide (TPR) repeat protein
VREEALTDFETMCFVIMPFGTKKVTIEGAADRQVDFDTIYDQVFKPAIEAARFPDGRHVVPRRVDKEFFAGNITQEMFTCIEYARLALTDISGLNANAFYELGVRHRARPSGTVILRQAAAPIPFDIKQIKAFSYEYEPVERADDSRKLITRTIDETLAENALDSPVQQALLAQRALGIGVETLLRDAENAIRAANWNAAASAFEAALVEMPRNCYVKLKLGLLRKDQGKFAEALTQFKSALADKPDYPAAWRERGIAEHKLGESGVESLERAIQLDPRDFDALASLGGILKRQGEFEAALECYRKATDVSQGHPYPLLNALKLEARVTGRLDVDARRKFQLNRAERTLRAHTSSQPPIDIPWSFFDLAECRLYAQDPSGFLENLETGCQVATAAWQAQTFRTSLALLVEGNVDFPGLAQGIATLDQLIPELPA